MLFRRVAFVGVAVSCCGVLRCVCERLCRAVLRVLGLLVKVDSGTVERDR